MLLRILALLFLIIQNISQYFLVKNLLFFVLLIMFYLMIFMFDNVFKPKYLIFNRKLIVLLII